MHDQTQASEVITARVEHIAQMAKDNSATIADATRVFESLHGVADQLNGAVGRFKLGSDSNRPAA
jgi:methyl-accepting chemotaxis protein